MLLLREIQKAATDSNVDLPSLLRKCKILASRLGSLEFKQWVNSELNGYAEPNNLPDYRVFRVRIHGDFADNGGDDILFSDAEIHEGCAPENIRKQLFIARFKPSAAQILVLFHGSFSGAKYSLDLRTAVNFSNKVYEDTHCLRAWQVIPANQLIGILDVIKSRILDFTLEIEAENPEAGEAAPNTLPIPQEKVQQVFNTYITGSGNNIVAGSHDFTQEATHSESSLEVFSQLLDALRAVSDQSIRATAFTVVEEMRAAKDKASFKAHYTQFISLLADHMQILGTVAISFLPALTKLLS